MCHPALTHVCVCVLQCVCVCVCCSVCVCVCVLQCVNVSVYDVWSPGDTRLQFSLLHPLNLDL